MKFSRACHEDLPIWPDWMLELNALAQLPQIQYEGPCLGECCREICEEDDSDNLYPR